MRKDNKGMTLIELLIAITILALITTPFLNSFIVSVRSNYKARNVLRATTVAQNLMEGIEAFSLEDICRQVNLTEPEKSLLYRPNGYAGHVEFANENGQKSSVAGEEFVPTDSNKYSFGIQGIVEDGIEYDARILIDASGYRYTGNAEEDKRAYNEGHSLELTTMNEKKDFIFSLPISEDEKIAGFKDAINAEYVEGFGDLKRTFKITVSDDSNGTKVNITVFYGEGINVITGNSLEKTVAELDNIYLMYYPNYRSVATKSYDQFEVELLTDAEFDLCLIKQKYKDVKDEKTNIYAPSLIVREVASLVDKQSPRVIVKTNIGKYLYDSNTPDKADALQCSYYQRDVQVAADNVGAMLGFVNGAPQTLLGEGKKVDPIFKTTVQIYPAGTYNRDDKTTFDSADILVQLEN